MIGVLDYGIGNVNSIVNMLKKIGEDSMLINHSDMIRDMDKLIIPGVGSFDTGMQKLEDSGMLEAINEHTLVLKKPILGICLGMQMLGRSSEEGSKAGLGFIPFDTKRFQLSKELNLKVPHMGWDIVSIELKDDSIVKDIIKTPRYYFVHSYHAVCDHQENVLMSCDYGYPFAAAVKQDNVYGFQFHPEKSHKFGMALLENFARSV